MNRLVHPGILLLVALIVATAGTATAQSSFSEDFSTTTYRDAVTTADWNTGTGELTLFPFTSSLVGADASAVSSQRVTVEGQYAYIGAGIAGVHVVDISNAAAPVKVATYNTTGYTRGIDIEGNLAYVADGLAGLLILDISDPGAPVVSGSYDTATYAWDVAVSGDRAYVADSAGGLLAFDVSGSTPILLGTYNTTGNAYGVEVDGDHVYVAGGSAGLQVIDVSDPGAPVQVGQYDTSGFSYGLVLEGQLAYLASLSGGLQVIDISNPLSPVLVGSYVTPSNAEHVDVAGDRAFVACGASGLLVIDISNPVAPSLIETVAVASSVRGVWVAGNMAYLADNSVGLLVVQVAEPAALEYVAKMYPGWTPSNVVVAGNLAVVTNSYSGELSVVDITDPTAPAEIGAYAHSSGIEEFVWAGDYLYLADASGLSVIDISDPSVPTFAASYPGVTGTTAIQVLGNYAYVAAENSEIVIIEITDPTAPVVQAFYAMTGTVVSMSVNGNTAYMLEESGLLHIVDITNPVVPVEISTYWVYSNSKDIVVVGDYAYVASQYVGLRIYDVSNPLAVASVGSFSTSGWSENVSVEGDYAFLGAGAKGFFMIDISDVTSPVLQGNYDALNTGIHTAVDGDYVYAVGPDGLQILKAFQSDFDTQNNLAQSTSRPIYEDAVAARVIPTEAGAVSWEVSPDHGSTWLPSEAGSWAHFDDTSMFLRWRATLAWSPDAPTAVDAATIEWLNEYAHITAVDDIAGDQGGQIRLGWLRSGRDFLGDSQQITEYAVYRQVDVAAKSMPALVDLSRQSFAVQEQAKQAAASGWDFVTTVPVRVQDDYSVVVPTLADSSVTNGQHLTTFMVSAVTAAPGVFFDSPPFSGYSVDNLAPNAPQALQAAYQADAVILDWDDAPEADFRYFRVYRGTDPAFVPGPGNLIKEVAASAWTDPTAAAWSYFYKVSAVDFAGNESAAGETAVASDVPGVDPAARYALFDAAPNPFNPATVLSFTLPGRSQVRLGIYDLAGRHVRTLVQETMEAGSHRVTWDGRDSRGGNASSGIYLYRIEAGEFSATKRMTLLK